MTVSIRPARRKTFRLTCRQCLQRFDLSVSLVPQAFGDEINRRFEAAKTAHIQNRGHEALKPYLNVFKEAPHRLDAIFGLAMVSLGLGDVGNALMFLERALLISPSDPRYHLAFADLLRITGEPAAAFLYYDQALTLSPGLPGVVEKKGVAQRGPGSRRRASGIFRHLRQKILAMRASSKRATTGASNT